MTESEWWAATDSLSLAHWLFFGAFATDRKLRLFSVACCRRVEAWAEESALSVLLDFAERFADGQFDEGQRAAVALEAEKRFGEDYQAALVKNEDVWRACLYAADAHQQRDPRSFIMRRIEPNPVAVVRTVLFAVGIHQWTEGEPDPQHAEELKQIRLLHDIFGLLPFRDIALNSAWLTSDVLALARGIYDDKAFDRMPILADALQDAGCDSDDILNHCRAEGWEHVRGCWVIDLLLGKPWRESP